MVIGVTMKYKTFFTILIGCILFTTTSISAIDVKLSVQSPQSTQIDNDIVAMIEQIDENLVFMYLNALMSFGPRYTGSDNCSRAGQYIFDEFEKMGLDTAFHEWRYDGFADRNVVGTLAGSNSPNNAEILFCAHYDCTPGSLGADDDGSGVAAVMAAASVMSNYSFNHTIKFVAFSGEEVGTYGSFSYARDAYLHGNNVYAVLNADMVGYADTAAGGNILRFFTVERSSWIAEYARDITESYHNFLDMKIEILPNHMGADHQAFLDYGFDGVWIAHHDNYPYANTPDDNPEHLNRSYQVKATKTILAICAEMAKKPIELQVQLTNPLEGCLYLRKHPIMPLDFLAKYWYKGLRGDTILLGRTMATADVFATEEVKYVIFCIDDYFIHWDYDPPYEWNIQGKYSPIYGKHTLDVYAITESGKMSSDEMDIFIITISSAYGPF